MRLTESFRYPEDEVGHGVAVEAGAFVRLDSTHHCLSIFSYKTGKRPDDNEPEFQFGLHHIAFEMPTPEELLALYRLVREEEVPIVNARKGGPGNQPRFYIRDPDGNLLEFYWGIDRVGWDGIPRSYEDIQEIDLDAFDFEAFARQREDAAEQAQAVAPSANDDRAR
jgi:catechol 2,3-dioxygenase